MREDNRRAAMIPGRDVVTNQQVDTLLTIVGTLQNYLLGPAPLEESDSAAVDGGIRTAAAVTFNNTCSCLDAILRDPSRWSLESTDEVLSSVLNMHEAQTEFLKEQTKSVLEVQRPAFQLRPTLLTLPDDDGFVAYYGDITTPGASIAGRGATPDDALKDFDAAFHRTSDEQILIVSEAVKEAQSQAAQELLPETPEAFSQQTKKTRKKKE